MQTSQLLSLKSILTDAIKRGAADIHFSVSNYPIIRVQAELVSLENEAIITEESMAALVASLVSEEQKKQLEKEREIILTYDFDKNLRFKITIFYQKNFLSATFRHIAERIPTLSALGVNPLLAELTKLNKGLIIVAGPFGSGRSTTAAAMIEEINQNRKKYIITIEDPIEYIFTNQKSIIEQREVGRDTNSFVDALRYFQEENGDVLFLEEMQDPATIPLVLEIARGSSLVITTTSADSAAKTVANILDRFQAFDQERIRDLLATALKAVVCQKLLPKIGGGAIVIQEILINSEPAKASILNGNISQLDDIIRTSKEDGMVSFDQVLAGLVQNRQITLDIAQENAISQEALENLLK